MFGLFRKPRPDPVLAARAEWERAKAVYAEARRREDDRGKGEALPAVRTALIATLRAEVGR